MSSQVSPNYTQTTFGQIAKKLVNGGTPPTEIAQFWNGKIPWITGADFTASGIGEFRRFVSETAITLTATNLIDQGQLLLVTRTGVGKLAIAPCDIAVSQDITGVYPDTEKVDVRFLYHRMRLGVEDLKKLNQGTSINGIIRSDLLAYRIELPTLPQQRRIAEILSTLDEAIEQTEALIAKHSQIKAGLMHDLFTRGVTPDGHLRPTREQAPELYKESPLGWIPKEWSVRPCSDICIAVIDCKNRTPPITSDGHPVIRTPNVRDGEFVWADLNYTDADSYVVWSARGKPQVGDIVITREAPVGEVCMLPETLQAPCLGQRMMLYRPNPEQVHAAYMLHALQSPRVGKHLDVISGGSTVGHVKVGEIRTLRLPCPDLEEQKIIAKALDAVRLHLVIENEQLDKLRQQKLGIMHDLLTGCVRAPEGIHLAAVVL